MNVDIIKKQKEALGLCNEDIASEVGVSIVTFYRWLNGSIKRIPEAKLEKLAKVLNVSINALKEEKKYCMKPILGQVKAGYDLFLQEDVLGYEEVNEREALQGDYYLQVVGDSMIGDRIFDGDLVYVKQTSEVSAKDVAVVVVGEEVTIKKVIRKDSMLILESSNRDCGNRYFNEEEVEKLPVKVIGKVVYSKRLFE